jgi:hypothetical protein
MWSDFRDCKLKTTKWKRFYWFYCLQGIYMDLSVMHTKIHVPWDDSYRRKHETRHRYRSDFWRILHILIQPIFSINTITTRQTTRRHFLWLWKYIKFTYLYFAPFYNHSEVIGSFHYFQSHSEDCIFITKDWWRVISLENVKRLPWL